ncbi:MAG: class E sortase [Patescibacteria group bacterium]
MPIRGISGSMMKTISPDKYLEWVRKTGPPAAMRIAFRAGIALVAVSVLVLVLTFLPVIVEEAKYQILPKHEDAVVLTREARKNIADSVEETAGGVIYPIDEEFGIVIPKLSANARVIPDVDWRDAGVYQRALTWGVAHAAGTAYPGSSGNVFIFSHSGVDFYEANRYNALFYLLNKLVPGDEIYLFYKGQRFVYRVAEQKTVSPESVEYLKGNPAKKTLTLMTCWPAGTTLSRLIVIAD